MSRGATGKRPKNCYARKDSPYWWYEVSIGGQRESGSTGYTDAVDAEEFVTVRRAALRAESKNHIANPVVAAITGETRSLHQNEIGWGDALQRFHDDHIIGTSDARNSLRRAGKLLNEIGDKMFHELTHADFFNCRQRRLRETNRYGVPISPLTANREMAHARQVFNHMVDCGVRMPIKPPKWARLIDNQAEVEAARVRELTPAEEARLLAACRNIAPGLDQVVEFAILSGQRKAAVLFLSHGDIDWQNAAFKVKLKGRGQKKRDHTVPLTTRMIEIIRAQPRVEGTDRVFTYVCQASRAAPDGGYLRKRGRRYPYTIAGWKKHWLAALLVAEIEDFRFHDLRHTNATRVVRQTGNLRAAQRILGHTQITTTGRYAHSNLDDARSAMQTAENANVEHQAGVVEERRAKLRLV